MNQLKWFVRSDMRWINYQGLNTHFRLLQFNAIVIFRGSGGFVTYHDHLRVNSFVTIVSKHSLDSITKKQCLQHAEYK